MLEEILKTLQEMNRDKDEIIRKSVYVAVRDALDDYDQSDLHATIYSAVYKALTVETKNES